jgi:hypothetical protein
MNAPIKNNNYTVVLLQHNANKIPIRKSALSFSVLDISSNISFTLLFQGLRRDSHLRRMHLDRVKIVETQDSDRRDFICT